MKNTANNGALSAKHDNKPVSTLFGYNVRSKSEALIADALHIAGLEYEYEKIIYDSDGKPYKPDFTIKFKSRIFFLEHLGMMEEPAYAKKWISKVAGYTKKIPGILITTRENDNICEQIINLIKDIFKIDISQRLSRPFVHRRIATLS